MAFENNTQLSVHKEWEQIPSILLMNAMAVMLLSWSCTKLQGLVSFDIANLSALSSRQIMYILLSHYVQYCGIVNQN